MTHAALVGRLRTREWTAGARYWLSVLGVDTQKADIMTQLYIVYLALFLGGWVAISWSGLVATAERLGAGRVGALWPVLPTGLYGLALVWWSVALARLPFLLPHGDLEWLASSPISRRAVTAGALLPAQLKALLVAAIASTVLFGLSGGSHLYSASALTTLAILALQATSWLFSVARATRAGRPVRWLWILPTAMIPLYVLVPWVRTPFRWVVAPFLGHPQGMAFLGIAVAWGVAWLGVMLLAGPLNLITIQSQSSDYAEIRMMQQGIGRQLNRQVIRDARSQNRLRRRRPWGRVPPWTMPMWEVGRFGLSVWRMPMQALYLLETAALFRSALFAVFLPSSTAWMFWLFVAYRFRRNALSRWYHRDIDVAFLRQFWTDDDLGRYTRSSIIPLVVAAALGLILWAALPLGIAMTPLHLGLWAGIVVSWYVAESPLLESAHSKSPLQGHERAVLATGIMVVVGAVLHSPRVALIIPGIVLLLAFIRTRRRQQSRDPS